MLFTTTQAENHSNLEGTYYLALSHRICKLYSQATLVTIDMRCAEKVEQEGLAVAIA